MTVVVDQDEEDAARIAAAQSDPAKFAALYRSHVHLVHAFAWSRLHDRAGAEDVTAETFRRALRALPRYEPRGVPFRAWLLRICANLVADEHARRARAARLAEDVRPASDAADLTAAVDERARLHALVRPVAHRSQGRARAALRRGSAHRRRRRPAGTDTGRRQTAAASGLGRATGAARRRGGRSCPLTGRSAASYDRPSPTPSAPNWTRWPRPSHRPSSSRRGASACWPTRIVRHLMDRTSLAR